MPSSESVFSLSSQGSCSSLSHNRSLTTTRGYGTSHYSNTMYFLNQNNENYSSGEFSYGWGNMWRTQLPFHDPSSSFSSHYSSDFSHSSSMGELSGNVGHRTNNERSFIIQRGLNNNCDHHNLGLSQARTHRSRFSPLPLPLRYFSLAQVQGYITLVAKDQHGCRFLSKILEEPTHENVQIVFNEIIDYVVELTMDQHGNYVMQKVLDVCNEEQRTQILGMVTTQLWNFAEISCNTQGTCVIQKLIQTLKTRQQISLLMVALIPSCWTLINHENGFHVILQCLWWLSNEANKFIFSETKRHCVEVATHKYGCHILQQCIKNSNGNLQENLIAELFVNSLMLAQDMYGCEQLIEHELGNYVIQVTLSVSKMVILFVTVYFSDFIISDLSTIGSPVMSLGVTLHLEEYVQSAPFVLEGHKPPSGNTWEMDGEKNLFRNYRMLDVLERHLGVETTPGLFYNRLARKEEKAHTSVDASDVSNLVEKMKQAMEARAAKARASAK
ncbi:putative pumilio homolog 7, chloroplastic [Humulus lupulus]|uniref:putative pumilio homolog 7, chloroplastic n=1 Tax=Humulus lupulus TaxID=3486 RepID=UPI002B415960|nr:putative pumilio homolog 7, chloroplastic [Humulus lupulus]